MNDPEKTGDYESAVADVEVVDEAAPLG